jgi:hypothetical protein
MTIDSRLKSRRSDSNNNHQTRHDQRSCHNRNNHNTASRCRKLATNNIVLTLKVSMEPKQKYQNCCSTKVSFWYNNPAACFPNSHTPKKVTPNGLPNCRNFSLSMLLTDVAEFESPSFAIDVLSLNSCVMAIPIDAKESDVRSHARNVRSVVAVSSLTSRGKKVATYQVQGDRAQRYPCSQVRHYRTSQQAFSNSFLYLSHPQTLDRQDYLV